MSFAQSSLFDDLHDDGAFTAVTAFNILHHLEDTHKVSRRIHTLLGPGGVFISSTACMAERTTILGTLVRVLTKLQLVADMHLFRERELEDLIAEGGFEIVETQRLSGLPDYFIVAKKLG